MVGGADTRTKFVRIEDGIIYYKTEDGRTIKLEAKPFIGTIGVAPESEAISTFTPGSTKEHGLP